MRRGRGHCSSSASGNHSSDSSAFPEFIWHFAAFSSVKVPAADLQQGRALVFEGKQQLPNIVAPDWLLHSLETTGMKVGNTMETSSTSLSAGGTVTADTLKNQLCDSVGLPTEKVSHVTMGTNPATCMSEV